MQTNCDQRSDTLRSVILVQKHVSNDNFKKLNVLTNDLNAYKNDVKSLQVSLHGLRECQVQQTAMRKDLRACVKHLDKQVCDCDSRFSNTGLLLQQNEKVIAENKKVSASCLPADDDIAITALRELCWEVTTRMYRVIFPESCVTKRRYSFEDLRRKIDRIKEYRLKQEKKVLLDEMVQQIAWNDDMEHEIQQLLEGYELQPSVKPFELNDRTIELIFTSDILLSDEVPTVRQLVKIWRTLNDILRKTAE